MKASPSLRDPVALQPVLSRVRQIAAEVVAPAAEAIDAEGQWPEGCLRALGDAGLLGLHVPTRLGGLGHGLTALALSTEILAEACPSVAMCFGMHCVGTAVIAAKATPDHEARFLCPIAQGRHITTLALSETGSGAHVYLPETRFERVGGSYRLDGTKQFVTNGGHADSYVISAQASGGAVGEFTCFVLEGEAGVRWLEPWQGMGMRGNSSRGMRLEGAEVPLLNLLGAEGDQVWYVFEVVAPFFIMAMAGTYLGIAGAAVEIAIAHLRQRSHTSGESLAAQPVLQHQLADLWIEVERTRALVAKAGEAGDAGSPDALPLILAAKAAAAETAVQATNEAMSMCGGIAYREDGRLARLLRDARAGPVMSPTTNLLKLWTGRTLLGLPLLA